MEKMNEFYTINEMSTITGLTTRTLRNYLKLGILNGEKIEGVWKFTPENLNEFLTNNYVKASMQTKKNAVVYDFMADRHKKTNKICTILDFCVGREEAMEISKFFCDIINERKMGGDISFGFEHDGVNQARVILKGSDENVMELLQQYYQ